MPWVPRLWHGMTFSAWWSLLRENEFDIALTRWPLAISVSAATVVNSALSTVQSLLRSRRMAAVQLPDDPVFVIGHWRSGTTLLHELLTLDPRHTYADTYACLAPSHFLVSRYLVTWWLQLLMPKCRPMDNVRVGWRQPQEDEWALCLLGLPSPYRTVAFPRRLPQCREYLDLRDLSAAARQEWDEVLIRFLKSVVLSQGSSRLILKSPTHTARIGHLRRLFPHARFVHVVRDPLTVFPSTLRLWTRLAADHGLQIPDEQELEQFVLESFVQMYDAFESQRGDIPPNRLCDVRYEQLVADPVGQLQQVYERLELGDFEVVRPHVQRRVATTADYQVNRYDLPDQQRDRVLSHWSDFCCRYGYWSEQARVRQSSPPLRKAG